MDTRSALKDMADDAFQLADDVGEEGIKEWSQY